MKILSTLGFAAAIAVVSTASFASDLPSKKKAPAPIIAPRAFSWNGVYAGINGGYLNTNAYGLAAASTGDAKGGIFGVTGGYNVQMPNNIVVGVEGDYGMSNADGSAGGGSSKLGSMLSLRARAGLAMDRFLPYVTGGYAGANVKTDNDGSRSEFANGWTAGAGVEYAFSDNLSAKAEALYVNFDKVKTDTANETVGYDGGLYRVGLNYHF